MKKIAMVLVLAFALGLVLSSCKTSVCPAYGEYRQYKRERAY